jgi:hypothetical protein
VTYLTFWFLFGFVLSAIFGVLATDLRRDEVRIENFKRAWGFWEFRQKLLAFVVGLWLALLAWAFTRVHVPDMVIGSVIGGAAAPWVWLHFARDFVGNQERGDAERETLIKTVAHKIWLEQGSPEGHAEEHYFRAKEQINSVEQDLIDASSKSGEQHLARYRLLSILLGIALLVATLIPILKDWLPRAQQFQAFGISLSLLATQPTNQSPRLNLLSSNAGQSSDRLAAAITFAYHIGAGPSPTSILEGIGPDLNDFRHLSIYDQDRSYIAWLTYELPRKGALERPKHKLVGSDVQWADNLTLKEYVDGAEDLLKTAYSPPRWVDIELDREFVSYSTLVSTCFREYIKHINYDPQLFMVATAGSLRALLQQTKVVNIGFENTLSKALENGETSKICTDQIALTPVWGPYYHPFRASRGQSPYPSWIVALYLAAIGAVDSGVRVLEDWIRDFNEHHDQLVPDTNPQLGWYLWRAKWGASALPYNYHGFVVPHRQLVTWQFDESNQLGRMLGVGGSDGWMRLCRRLLTSTLHTNVGRQLAFRYALERFYLFENLLLEDFEKDSGLGLGSVTDLLREAEAIRDNRGCLERVKAYRDSDKQYTSYFRLYTAQLRFNLLASENKTDRCKSSLIETIERELDQADQFGVPVIERTLLPASDIWEAHRVRLRFLREQLEDTKRECST